MRSNIITPTRPFYYHTSDAYLATTFDVVAKVQLQGFATLPNTPLTSLQVLRTSMTASFSNSKPTTPPFYILAQATGIPTPVVLPDVFPENKTIADAWLEALSARSAQVMLHH